MRVGRRDLFARRQGRRESVGAFAAAVAALAAEADLPVEGDLVTAAFEDGMLEALKPHYLTIDSTSRSRATSFTGKAGGCKKRGGSDLSCTFRIFSLFFIFFILFGFFFFFFFRVVFFASENIGKNRGLPLPPQGPQQDCAAGAAPLPRISGSRT